MIFVLDASAIIAFYSEICKPQILHELTEKGHVLIVPTAVVTEISKGRKSTWSTLEKAIEEKKITVETDFSQTELQLVRNRYPNLHDGEIQVLIVGIKLKKKAAEYKCIIDESPARKIAKRNQIAITGTYGLLDVLNDLGVIEERQKENFLNKLEHSKFRLKSTHVSV
jgi:predicted nucleic acid-binding protein